jgi:hypothetical protein
MRAAFAGGKAIGEFRGFAVVGSWECEEKAQTEVVYIANEEGRCNAFTKIVV